jgi:hypothetical protein
LFVFFAITVLTSDKQMLRDLLSAAAHLVGPAYQRDAWRYRARLLRNDLTPVLAEIDEREKAESH